MMAARQAFAMRILTMAALVIASLALAVSGCSKKNTCGPHCGCFSIDDCSGDNICFLGTCQAPGYNISTVYVDLLPTLASGLLAQQDSDSPRHLAGGLNLTIALQGAKILRGEVHADSGGTLSGLLKWMPHPTTADAVVLPSAQSQAQAVVSPDMGFRAALVAGSYDFTFEPSHAAPALPPLLLPDFKIIADQQTIIPYPDTTLARISGVISARSNQLSPISGAQVDGVAISQLGTRLVSTSAITDSTGAYTLLFPPTVSTYSVTVRPGNTQSANPLVPVMTFGGLMPPHDDLPIELALNIPTDTVSLTALVHDTAGVAVPDATVFFRGQVGEGPIKGTFSATSTSDRDGVVQVTLIPGRYEITVAPASDQTNALSTSTLCVNSAMAAPLTDCVASVAHNGTITLPLPQKVDITGRVLSIEGKAVPASRVVYTLNSNAVTQRQFTTTAAADGSYTLAVDPSQGTSSADYEVTVEPDQSSGLPRHRELLHVEHEAVQHDIKLFAPSLVYGRVVDPNGAPLADVTIAFYSVDLGSAGQPLLVGLGKSTVGGEFVVPLPTANTGN